MTIMTRGSRMADRLEVTHGRGRVAGAIHALALDLVDPYAQNELCSDDWDCLCELVRGPVEAATNAALNVLIESLEDTLPRADPRLVERIELVRRRSALGID